MTMIEIRKSMSIICATGLVVAGASLWGQQPDEQIPDPPPNRTAREKPKRSIETNSGPAHQVEPPDLLLVEVLEALPGRPISGERLVRPDGTISLGFYGDVHVAGLTLPEVKEKIILHMRKYLIDEVLGLTSLDENEKCQPVDPKDSDRVFVDVTAYNSRWYYIEGDVYLPSRLAYTGNESVLDVIHYVGGILPSADRSKIRLIRSFPKGSPVKVMPIDYEEITMGTDSSTNYQLLPNDRLVVPHQPNDPSPKSAPVRSSQSSPSRLDNSYFPSLSATDPSDSQVSSLHALERHLGAVERKLDRLIEVMQTATIAARPKRDKAEKKPGSQPAGVPEVDSRASDHAEPSPAARGRSPFDSGAKPPEKPKDE
jgi:polysaccharide biosynthesis/export protein